MTWSYSHLVTMRSHITSQSHKSQRVGHARDTMQGEPGVGVRGPGSLTPLLKVGLVQHSPRTFLIRSSVPLAHAVPEVEPVECPALPHKPTRGRDDPLFCPGQRAKHSLHLHFKWRTQGLQLHSSLPCHPK